MTSLGEQLRRNIEDQKAKDKKALEQKLKTYTDEISKWIQEGKTVPAIRYKDNADLFEEETLSLLRDWADKNGMSLFLWDKGYTSEYFFKFEPKEV